MSLKEHVSIASIANSNTNVSTMQLFMNVHWHKCCRCCSVTRLCPAPFDPMDCSIPGPLALHYLLEFAHVLWVNEAISPPYPLLLVSFCLQSFPPSGSFPVSWLFVSSGQSINNNSLMLMSLIFSSLLVVPRVIFPNGYVTNYPL